MTNHATAACREPYTSAVLDTHLDGVGGRHVAGTRAARPCVAGGLGPEDQDWSNRLRRAQDGAALNAIGAATKVIYPSAGYHTEDAAEGTKIGRPDITIVALADLFEDRLLGCEKELAKVGIDVAANRCFVGFDAYEKLLADPEVNYVIQATPPHFRPMHLLAAIKAGKHVFIEKPAAVDAPGVRMVMEAGKLAEANGLGIAAGTQRRHLRSYQETIQRLRDGAIGDIIYGKCYWNGGQIWVVDREPTMSDMEWQLRNWNYFTWLSGDHIVEQHVHNLDIMNWVLGTHPVRAVSGLGGRQVRSRRTARQYLRPFCGRVRVSKRCVDVQSGPAD